MSSLVNGALDGYARSSRVNTKVGMMQEILLAICSLPVMVPGMRKSLEPLPLAVDASNKG